MIWILAQDAALLVAGAVLVVASLVLLVGIWAQHSVTKARKSMGIEMPGKGGR